MKLSKLDWIKVIALLFTLISPFKSFAQEIICQHGLEYEFSTNRTWGKAYPVITFISPNSPAEQSGLRQNDIIEKIDDVNCLGLDKMQIDAMLEDSKQAHIIQVSNFGYRHKLRFLKLKCKYEDSLSEAELAQLFSKYSPKDVRDVTLSYPFSIEINGQTDWCRYRTFACPQTDGTTKEIDTQLNHQIENILKAKGLKQVPEEEAELLISTFYELKPINTLKNGEGRFSWRYDSQHKSLSPQPILATKELANWELLFGITIQKQTTKQIIWSAEAREWLYNPMTIAQYASANLQLILTNFPFTQKVQDLKYKINILRYNYMGLSFSANDLSLITDVTIGSPAFESGLRAGDKVLAINKKTFSSRFLGESIKDYQGNMKKLEKFQDSYRDIRGLSLNFYRKADFPKINEYINRPHWHTALSYLFAFRRQIAENPSQTIIFEVERKGEHYTVPIKAIIRDESSVRLCK